jgi:hypothetical protein
LEGTRGGDAEVAEGTLRSEGVAGWEGGRGMRLHFVGPAEELVFEGALLGFADGVAVAEVVADVVFLAFAVEGGVDEAIGDDAAVGEEEGGE